MQCGRLGRAPGLGMARSSEDDWWGTTGDRVLGSQRQVLRSECQLVTVPDGGETSYLRGIAVQGRNEWL